MVGEVGSAAPPGSVTPSAVHCSSGLGSVMLRSARQPDVRIGTCRSMAVSAAVDTATSRPQRSPARQPAFFR